LAKNYIDKEGIFEEAKRGFVILYLVYFWPSLSKTFLTKERVSAFNLSS
jgi:hypothetical protein